MVLKRAAEWRLPCEAEMHWIVSHPNVAKPYGLVANSEVEDAEQLIQL